jgi:hypothetical protein
MNVPIHLRRPLMNVPSTRKIAAITNPSPCLAVLLGI